jgi:hypothetical protein
MVILYEAGIWAAKLFAKPDESEQAEATNKDAKA